MGHPGMKHGSSGHTQQHHQGRIRHADMTSLPDGYGTSDPLAHSSHDHFNDYFGTPAGMSPEGDYGDGGETDAGGAMGDNCSME
jgi:hypothetical protein